MYRTFKSRSAYMMLTGALSTICLIRVSSPCRASTAYLSEASLPIVRSAPSRAGDVSVPSVEKKSSVPTRRYRACIGSATAVLIPARRASGARQQSCSSPRSAT